MQKLNEAMRLDTAFGLYFLVPMLLAVALLLLEGGIVTRNRQIQYVALFVPFLCLALSFTPRAGSAPYVDFLDRFVGRVGSPLWLTSLAGLAFFAYAGLRQVRFAGESFWGALLVASCISRTTIDVAGLVSPQTWALWSAAIIQGAVGLRERQSWRVFTAALCTFAAIRSDLLPGAEPLFKDFLPLQLAGLAVLCVGATFDDMFAHGLRWAGVPLLLAAAIGAAVVPGEYLAGLPQWSVSLYAVTVVAISFIYGYGIRSPAYFFAGLANGCLLTGRLLFDLSGMLKRLFAWDGAAWFVWGIVWFALGVLISAWKAGLVARVARFVPRGGKSRIAKL